MTNPLSSIPVADHRLELPDVYLASEEGWALTSMILGALLLGVQAVLPPLPATHDIRLSVSGPAAASILEESEPARDSGP